MKGQPPPFKPRAHAKNFQGSEPKAMRSRTGLTRSSKAEPLGPGCAKKTGFVELSLTGAQNFSVALFTGGAAKKKGQPGGEIHLKKGKKGQRLEPESCGTRGKRRRVLDSLYYQSGKHETG